MEINEAFPGRKTNPADFVKLTEKNEKKKTVGHCTKSTPPWVSSPAGNICSRAIASRQSETGAQAEIKEKGNV